MKMARLIIQVPISVKDQLKALRSQGLTAAGLIRHLLTQYLNQPHKGRKAR